MFLKVDVCSSLVKTQNVMDKCQGIAWEKMGIHMKTLLILIQLLM